MDSFQNELGNFERAFPSILEDLKSSEELVNNQYLKDWVDRVINYNVPFGKKSRGVTTVLAYKAFTESVDEETLRKACILGWCVEILQASFLVADDIMDYSEKRRGRSCWYKLPGIGLSGFNDALLLENIIYSLISKHFSRDPHYSRYTDLFRDVTLKTIYGETIDLRTPHEKDFKNYTMGTYSFQVKYKTSYYTFYLPIMIGIYLAGKGDQKELISQIKDIVFELGFLFQSNDDILDCFGNPHITGKIGTDIEDGKCTYLVVRALEIANEEQRRILKNNYGKGMNGKEEAAKVKGVFKDLKLTEKYAEFEEEAFSHIQVSIKRFESDRVREFFQGLLKLTYKRKV